MPFFQEQDQDASSDEEPHFSLITGQYKSGPFHRANSGGPAQGGKKALVCMSFRSEC